MIYRAKQPTSKTRLAPPYLRAVQDYVLEWGNCNPYRKETPSWQSYQTGYIDALTDHLDNARLHEEHAVYASRLAGRDSTARPTTYMAKSTVTPTTPTPATGNSTKTASKTQPTPKARGADGS